MLHFTAVPSLIYCLCCYPNALFSPSLSMYIDQAETHNVSLSTCLPGTEFVSTTIANLGFPMSNVTCSGQGVTVETDTITVTCSSHNNGDIIKCNATNGVGSQAFFLFFRKGMFIVTVNTQNTTS